MNLVTLTDIPFKIDFAVLLKYLHLRPNDEDALTVRQMATQAEEVGQPKAIYQVSSIEMIDDHQVRIDDISFTSRILRVNMDGLHRVFPYIATCGMELHHWSEQFDDRLLQFWADMIKAMALTAATNALHQDLQTHYMPGPTATMNPGSLSDWPLREQQPFFKLFNGAVDSIGVVLSSSCLMTPNKSVTGIQFSTERLYENCQLCPRDDCPGRRAPYDEKLFDRYGLPAGATN
jgi:hypothetical protein